MDIKSLFIFNQEMWLQILNIFKPLMIFHPNKLKLILLNTFSKLKKKIFKTYSNCFRRPWFHTPWNDGSHLEEPLFLRSKLAPTRFLDSPFFLWLASVKIFKEYIHVSRIHNINSETNNKK